MNTAAITIRPSGAAGWVVCPGKPRLEALYPEDTSSEAAREGTAAHWALSEVLNSRAVAEGQLTPDKFVLTAEMVEAAEDVLRWVIARIAAHGGETPRLFSEQHVRAGRVHTQCQGTLDLALYFPHAGVLYLADYKFGHGWVEVFENWQLLCYLAGLLEFLDIDGLAEQSLRVVLAVIQPRSYHPEGAVRTWQLQQASDARPYINTLSNAAHRTLEPDAVAIVNPTCQHCDARHACPALQAAGLAAIDQSKRAVPFDLPPHALGIELADVRKAIKALEARETGLAGQAEALIKGGQRVPFWGIESKPGALAWTKPTPEILTLGQMLGFDLKKPDAAITPTQARDRGLDPSLLEAFAERKAGAAKLVPMTDTTARKIFS